MKTIIDWKDPNLETPPFNQPFVAGLGSSETRDAGATWQKTVTIRTVVMRPWGPLDDEGTDYLRQEFEADDRWPGCFSDYQFCLETLANDDDDPWYSDCIVQWVNAEELESMP